MGRSRLEGNTGDSSGSESSRSRSRSASAKSEGSPARSPKSGSGSPRSRTGSPKSGTGSPKSGAGASPKSGAGSPRSRSASPARSPGSPARSRSGSPARSNNSGSPSRAKSKTPAASRSPSRSRSRSRSRSPGSDAEPTERKGVSDSESDTEASKKRKHSDGSGNDSGSDIGRRKKKSVSGSPKGVKSASGSPKSPKDMEAEKATQDDIFGDDLSISSEDEEDAKAKKAVIREDDDDEVARYEDDGLQGAKKLTIDSDSDNDGEIRMKPRAPSKSPVPDVPETRIDVEVPKIQTDLGKEIHFVKLPNFLSVESRPFDGETYEDEMDDEATQQDEEGRTRLKLKVENTIRWRQGFDKEGHSIKESNARIVKWSDGSYSLHLGNEIFDVHKQPLQSDFNHLFIRQGTGLQGQAVFRTKLSFRPHSTDSQTHKKMTLSMADRSSKTNQIKVISMVGADPDVNRWGRIRDEETKLRQSLRNDGKNKRVPSKGSKLSGGYLEGAGGDSDDDAAVSIAAIKAKYGKGGAAAGKGGASGGASSGLKAGPGKPVYSSGSDSDSGDSRKGGKSSGSDSDSGKSKSSRKSRSRSVSSKSRSPSSSRSRSASPASKKSSDSD